MKMYNPPHPGEVLREMYLNSLKLTVTEVAKRLGVTRKAFSDLLNENAGISPKMALKLGKAFDTSAEYWLNMQQQYNLWKVREEVNIGEIIPFIEVEKKGKHIQ